MSPSADTTDLAQLLVSLQLSDSAFPSGFYTMSHGLEGFHQAHLVASGDVGALLDDLLVTSVGPGDATALARAHEAADVGDWATVAAVDRLLFAAKLNAEMRSASVRSGRQLIGLAAEVFGDDDIAAYAAKVTARTVPGCQPIVSAICYAATGVSRPRAVASDLFAFAASFVGAALRMRLTDHRGAQVILRRVAATIEMVTADALVRPIDDLGGYAPMADISSARHERADGRLFTS
ncbi:MAG: urease accessory UreF family protein [Ilumatobacteraceae bacterium]